MKLSGKLYMYKERKDGRALSDTSYIKNLQFQLLKLWKVHVTSGNNYATKKNTNCTLYQTTWHKGFDECNLAKWL